MDRLPPIEEQEWMLDCLRLLIHRRGADPLLSATLGGPRRGDLGRWRPTPQGVGRFLRRLLDGIGLTHIEVRVLPARAPLVERGVDSASGPVWFGGLAAGTAWFACDLLRLPKTLGEARAAMVGPAVQLWRQDSGLRVEDPATEERLRDLSAVYLGLGVLAVNRAERWRRELGVAALIATGRGGLSPAALAYLVAAQLLARRATCVQTVGVARRLPSGPRRSFIEALRQLRRIPGGIGWRLGLPGEEASGRARLAPLERKKGTALGALHRGRA